MKKNKGITLIALIITIIIMLILVAVSVSILINSGLIGKAREAGQETKTAYEQDQRIGENITINGVMYNSIDEYIGTLDDGDAGINWEQVLATAEKHPDQQNSENIGIGTDGNPVNMDLWQFAIIRENEIGLCVNGSGINPGYSNNQVINGQIQGTIPQFVKVSGEDDFYVVTSLGATFAFCTNLTIPPEIPDTVYSLSNTFYHCTNLATAPVIPEGVTDMYFTFALCNALTTAPEIPSNVTNMSRTFYNCNSLTGDLVINASSLSFFGDCLENAATNAGCDLKLSGTSTQLSNILATKSNNSNISLK